jgi:hypothetical protein
MQSQVEQLRTLLDTERRASSNAKNDAINYVRRDRQLPFSLSVLILIVRDFSIEQKMEFERVQEEFRDTQQRLEKQLDELRDTVSGDQPASLDLLCLF